MQIDKIKLWKHYWTSTDTAFTPVIMKENDENIMGWLYCKLPENYKEWSVKKIARTMGTLCVHWELKNPTGLITGVFNMTCVSSTVNADLLLHEIKEEEIFEKLGYNKFLNNNRKKIVDS